MHIYLWKTISYLEELGKRLIFVSLFYNLIFPSNHCFPLRRMLWWIFTVVTYCWCCCWGSFTHSTFWVELPPLLFTFSGLAFTTVGSSFVICFVFRSRLYRLSRSCRHQSHINSFNSPSPYSLLQYLDVSSTNIDSEFAQKLF